MTRVENSNFKARTNIRKILEEKSADFFGKSELTVRVNSMSSGLVGEGSLFIIDNQNAALVKNKITCWKISPTLYLAN